MMAARESAFRPLAPPKNLTVKLVDLLAAEITSGKLAPAARLPTEQAMMASFGASRPAIPQAASPLPPQGLVLIHQRQPLGIERRDSEPQAAFRRKVQGQHHAIHGAMAAAAAPAARAAMRAHLESSINRYSRYEAELTGAAKKALGRKPQRAD